MYYFDAHCDFLYNFISGKNTALTDEAVKKARLKKSVFAVFEGKGIEDVDRQLAAFESYSGNVNAFAAFEGLSWVKSLFDTERILSLNPVYVAPMWNNKNDFGGSCNDDGALTSFGMCFLQELSQNKIAVDLAHTGKNMFYSCIERFDNVIFSHGNVFEICQNKRNIDKTQIKLLIEKNGFFGLTLYPEFVGGNTLHKLMEHIDFVLEAGGENILGIGSDFDGCPNYIENAADVSVLEELYSLMKQRGYDSSVIEKITHKNAERVFNC